MAIANKKKEALMAYYQEGEGKKVLLLAELFLDEIKKKVENGELTDLTRDYVFRTTQYEFKVSCSGEFHGNATLKIYHRQEKTLLFKSWFLYGHINFHVYFPYDQTWSIECFSKHELFAPLLNKLAKIHEVPYVEITLPEEAVETILKQKDVDAKEVVAQARALLTKHRKQFNKPAFANCTHTIRTLEQTLPLLTPRNSQGADLIRMIQIDLLKIIEEYVELSEEGRNKQEERLLRYMHVFYLEALHVLELEQD